VLIFILVLSSVVFVSVVLYYGWYNPNQIYTEAVEKIKEEEYLDAITLLSRIKGWKDTENIITECYVNLFTNNLKNDNLSEAFKTYDIVIERDDTKKDILVLEIYGYAISKMNDKQYDTALELYMGILKGYRNSDYLYNLHIYTEGLIKFNEDSLIEAYDIFMTVDTTLVPEAIEKIEICKKTVYENGIDEFYSINMINDVFTMDIILPDALLETMLDDYLDTWKYREYSALVGVWTAKDKQKNIEMIYELDDFLDVKDNGFAMQRLFQRRYINNWGIYFYINKDGEAETNIPHYHLSGYYGLYSKIANGIYYIGSDEVKWTKQFSFRFDDFDETLYVYSYATSREYHLKRDETPVYA